MDGVEGWLLTLGLPERGIEPFERKAVPGGRLLVGSRRADPLCRPLASARGRFGDRF